MTDLNLIRSSIRAIADFPKPGIIFRDIAPLLADPKAFRAVIDLLKEKYSGKVDAIAGIDSRGFLFGAPLALELGVPFIMVRKPNKLPGEVCSQSYALEYGTNTLEVQKDAVGDANQVLLLDDLLATGGSAKAAASLLESVGANIVSIAFIIELEGLNGRDVLKKHDVFSLLTF